MKFWNNPNIVNKTPLITTLCFESANVSQLWRMWTERSSDGQSLFGWILINLAILLWLNFYRVCVPPDQRKWPIIAGIIGAMFNASVIASVIYFRYYLH